MQRDCLPNDEAADDRGTCSWFKSRQRTQCFFKRKIKSCQYNAPSKHSALASKCQKSCTLPCDMPDSCLLTPDCAVHSLRLYNSPPQSRSRLAACSGVMSRCGSAIISYPTKNLRTVALRSRGG
nr:hypothetical protein CFP56_11220 [Quercus suber]